MSGRHTAEGSSSSTSSQSGPLSSIQKLSTLELEAQAQTAKTKAYLEKIIPKIRDGIAAAAAHPEEEPYFFLGCYLLEAAGCTIPSSIAEIVEVQTPAVKSVLESRQHLPLPVSLTSTEHSNSATSSTRSTSSAVPSAAATAGLLRFARTSDGHLTSTLQSDSIDATTAPLEAWTQGPSTTYVKPAGYDIVRSTIPPKG